MGDTLTRHRRPVLLALLTLALLLGPAEAQAAGDGTARYRYKVTGFDYQASAVMFGAVEPNSCNPGVDSAFVGKVNGGVGELAPLGGYGGGSLRIGNRGTTGWFNAESPVDFSLIEGYHEVITACDDPIHPGQPTNSTATRCTETLDEDVSVNGFVDAGVGDRVSISWNVRSTGGDGIGSAVPIFTCVEPLVFADVNCKTRKTGLATFTQKALELRYSCVGATTKVPVGQRYTEYLADTRISGSLVLKRTKRS